MNDVPEHMAKRPGLLVTLLIALLTGCEEPAPRFESPLASGVITLPLRDTQRFDTLLSSSGFVAALLGTENEHEVTTFGPDAEVVLLHLPRSRFAPVIIGGGATGTGLVIDDGFSVVAGSGFVSEFNPVSPLGLLQIDGSVLSELTRHGYTRVLGIQNGTMRVISRSDFHHGLFESALQVGPGIVEQGELAINPTERNLPRYVRAFVATCADRWLIGVTQQPVHLYDLGGGLIDHFASEAIDCDEVVNLSGDREALLLATSADRGSIAYFGNPTLPKASLIAFRETFSDNGDRASIDDP